VRFNGKQWIEENQGKHFCQCGCGEVIPIKIHHHVRGIPKFLNFHAFRVIKPGLGKCGALNNNYKCGKHLDKRGYVRVLVPGPGRSNYQYEHRAEVEATTGRTLGRNEVVHHDNRNKGDNSQSNLIVDSRSEHSRMHALAGEIGFRLLKKRGVKWHRRQK